MKDSFFYKSTILSLTIFILITQISYASSFKKESLISTVNRGKDFPLFESGEAAPLCLSSQDFPGVLRVAGLFQTDIKHVTNSEPELIIDKIADKDHIILIGTIGKNPRIDKFIQENKLDVSDVIGKRETFLIQKIDNPIKNVKEALIIAGSDKRGTIYGMFEISRQMGVSPWIWWADVPVKTKSSVYISSERYISKEPKVKYRGIFINDEAPALSGWVHEKYGGFNSEFYEKVFQLILRNKGNFLWPAMWGRAFYDDDPENPRLADEYGIVVSTSHHEPMMRAHVEWERYGKGPWNYKNNETRLQEFWREGIERMGDYESVVTLAMRGDGDEPMSREADIDLLQRIVKDQRQILHEVTGKELTEIPQVWALYKEVQMYYDMGMRVPDDVTLLLCDDNWGNIRKLPKLNDPPRSGGYGIYYHFDYVGGPRNYKWLNTTQISRVWEQMHLAYEYGARRIWVVNVGDIKPMEFPISFFLDYAWNPEEWPAERLPGYVKFWAEEQFEAEHADEIAHILTEYTRYNSRRKPELLSPDTYSLIHFNEADRIVKDFRQLEKMARIIYDDLPEIYRDAFYQLVLHPVEACANLNDLYVTTGKNRLYARQGRASANDLAKRVKILFEKDKEITRYYNTILAGGKWDHFMDQTHIGYTYWQQPDENSMPEVEEIKIKSGAEMGVAIEGSDKWWPEEKSEAILPDMDKYNKTGCYIDIFNRGDEPFHYQVKTDKSWIQIDHPKGEINQEKRITISVDWEKAPEGKHNAKIIVTGSEEGKIPIQLNIHQSSFGSEAKGCYIENNGFIAIEAEHYSKVVNTESVVWQRIPDLGRTLSAMTPFPVTMTDQTPGGESACLEYNLYITNPGDLTVKAILSPTLTFHNEPLRYAISIDDENPQIINIHEGWTFQDWEESVRTNTTIGVSKHAIAKPGRHILKYWAVDPGVVLQRINIWTQEEKESYLGPPESCLIQ